MTKPRSHRALLILGIFLLGTCMRTPFTSIPSVINQIANTFHVPATSLGILTTIPLICFGLCSPLIPRLGQRLGNERALLFALVILLIGSQLRIFGYAALLFGTLLIGIAASFLNVLIPAVVTDRLPNRIGPVTGMYNVALTLFSAIGAYAIAPITERFSWQLAVQLLSLLVLITTLVWWPSARGAAPQKPAPGTSSRGQNMWKNRRAWYLMIYFGISSFVFYTCVAWLPSIAITHGMTTSAASLIAGLFQLFSIPTAFVTPLLATRMANRVPLVVLAGLLTALGFFGLLLPGNSFPLYVGIALVLGLGTAATFSLIMTLFGLKTRTVADTSNLSGMVQTLGYLLAALGPLVTGNLKAQSGSWTSSIWLTIAMVAIFTLYGVLSERHKFMD